MNESTTIAGLLGSGVVAVTGDDRASYLHAVLSQRIEGREPGEVAGALHLDGKGRPLAVMDVVVLEDRILLILPDREAAEELSRTLGGRTFLADARFGTLDVEVVAVRGPDGGPPAGRAVVSEGDLVVIGRDHGFDLVGPAPTVEERLDTLNVERAEPDELDAWRTEHGVPAWGREIRAPHLPEEMGLLPTHVHLEKGCYPGQEAVARMWMLGRPRRRLATVLVDGAQPAGWTTGSGRAQVELTSVADRNGTRVGMAYVPPDAQPGDRFEDEDGAVVVREIVGAGRPVPGHDPAVQRRRDR